MEVEIVEEQGRFAVRQAEARLRANGLRKAEIKLSLPEGKVLGFRRNREGGFLFLGG